MAGIAGDDLYILSEEARAQLSSPEWLGSQARARISGFVTCSYCDADIHALYLLHVT